MVGHCLIDPTTFITQHEPTADALDAYEKFDTRERGSLKTVLSNT